MPTDPVTPDTPAALFAELMARTTSPRARASLTNVRDALESLAARRGAEITVAACAREIQAIGRKGPKEQSIRNPEGADYRLLISAYARAHRREPGGSPVSKTDELILGITDPMVQARFRQMQADFDFLQHRHDLLKRAFAELRPVDLDAQGRDEAPALPSGQPAPPDGPQFSELERRAAREFLENYPMLPGVKGDEASGALVGPVREVAGPGFLQALRKIAGDPPVNMLG